MQTPTRVDENEDTSNCNKKIEQTFQVNDLRSHQGGWFLLDVFSCFLFDMYNMGVLFILHKKVGLEKKEYNEHLGKVYSIIHLDEMRVTKTKWGSVW